MGYYVRSDYSNYYVGDQIDSTDIAVTERPYPTCDWDGAAWVYDIPETRIAAKRTYNVALETDVNDVSSLSTDYPTSFLRVLFLSMFTDAVSYTDNSANNTPFYTGYLATSGLANKAAVHAAIKNDYDFIGEIFGKLMARRNADFALIDAAATGADIIAIVYVRPF